MFLNQDIGKLWRWYQEVVQKNQLGKPEKLGNSSFIMRHYIFQHNFFLYISKSKRKTTFTDQGLWWFVFCEKRVKGGTKTNNLSEDT